MKEIPDLIIPVYLNQRMVFDLVAMLKGGIATVTMVTEGTKDTSSVSGEVTGSFGLSQALASLFKVSLSAKAGGGIEESSDRSQSEERIHTPASLLYYLRNLLSEKKLLKQDEKQMSPHPGDFIEFSAVLSRNPIIEAIDSIIQVADMVLPFMEDQKDHKGVKQKKRQDNEFIKIKKQMESMAVSLKAGDTLDLTTSRLACSYKAIVTLQSGYLNDPTLSDLVDRTFKVLGKVIMVVIEKQGHISLIRKTALSRMPPNVITSFKEIFQKLSLEEGFPVPSLEWEIGGPVIQILPVAIFA